MTVLQSCRPGSVKDKKTEKSRIRFVASGSRVHGECIVIELGKRGRAAKRAGVCTQKCMYNIIIYYHYNIQQHMCASDCVCLKNVCLRKHHKAI